MNFHLFINVYVRVINFLLCSGCSSEIFITFYWSRLPFSLSYQFMLCFTLNYFYRCNIRSLLFLLVLFWNKFGNFFNEVSWEWVIEVRVGFGSFDFEWIWSTCSSYKFNLRIGVGNLRVFIGYELSVESFKHKIEMILFLFQSNE